MTSRPLRPWQVAACDSIDNEWAKVRSTLLVAATGCGKSRTFAEVIRRNAVHGPILVIAHRTELIEQAIATIKAETGLAVGREQASQRAQLRNLWGVSDRVVVGSIQTLHAKRLQDRFRRTDFSRIIIDEAHHAVASNYRGVFDYFNEALILGVTATPDRGDEVGLSAVFDSVAFQYDILQGIADGYLCDIQSREIIVPDLDISSVKVTMSADSGKDLNASQLAKLLDLDGPMHAIAGPLVREAGTRQTVVFMPSVETAHHLAAVLAGYTNRGVRAIDGTTAQPERSGALNAYQRGEVQFLVNCAVLTEGWDSPATACVAICRATKSRQLYAQMIGRGTRVAPGKVDCLVLDFVPEQSGTHKLVTPLDVLGGKDLPDDVAKEAKALAQAGMPATEALEAAEAAKAERQESERLRDEARKNKLRIQTEYQLRQVDPFGVLAPDDLTGKPATQKTRRTLDAMRIDIPGGTTEKAARNIIAEVQKRRRLKLCSYKQASIFQRRGLSINIPAAEAPAIIDSILANGPDRWRNPTPANVLEKWKAA